MERVRLTKNSITMVHHSQDPFNPHPTFPQWSIHSIYPYPFWGTMYRVARKQRYFMPALENEYLRLTIAPDIGGRIWDLYDKVGQRHLANFTSGVRSYNSGFGLNYTCGGIEINYPLAHSCTTNAKREMSFQESDDGSAAIIIGEYDRIWRTRWSVTYRLRPGQACVEQIVRVYNRSSLESRYMYWSNCGFLISPNTQFIFPEEKGSRHGHEATTFSWPLWRHHDMSLFRDVAPEPIGLYFLDSHEPFFGYYDLDNHFGLVHYADLADLPGKKNWTWGSSEATNQRLRLTHHADHELYGEVQAGRIDIQEHMDRVPPETEFEWKELWYPVRNIGAFNGAGPGAAVHAEVLDASAEKSRLKLSIMSNRRHARAMLCITSRGADPVEEVVSLDPRTAFERTITVRGMAGPEQATAITLTDVNGAVLARCRLRKPNMRDCWREVIDVRHEVQPVGAEQLFRDVETKARDCGNYDLKPLYEKVVAVDGGFSPARRELGKLALQRGNYAEAAEHLLLARRRDPDALENRYYHGMALAGLGEVEEARQAFELSCRYDWEMRSRARLAEMCLRDGDYSHAVEHLDRVAAAHPRLTRCRAMRAFALRRMGRLKEALAEITAARTIDGQDPFLQYEEVFIRAGGGARPPAKAMKALLEQVRHSELPLLEAALDYFDIAAYAEVEGVVKSIPEAGALAQFLLAYAQGKLGGKAAMATLRKACRSEPAYQHAWQQEFIEVLSWAREALPSEPRPAWHLGNLYMARRRAAEGYALWKEAERLGEKHYLLHSSLGYYEKKVASNPDAALACFRKADAASRGDLYVKHEIYELLESLNRRKEACAYLEGQTAAVRQSPKLASDLLNNYLKAGRYADFDALCREVDFRDNWQIAGPHILWQQRWMTEALALADRGELQRALDIMLNPKPAPANLGVTGGMLEADRRYYHAGRICEKLGQMEKAREYWEKAVAEPHYTGYETAYQFGEWAQRYFQALCLQKLGRTSEAVAFFDAMELVAQNPDLPIAARRQMIDLVERGRFAPDDAKDPAAATVEVQTRAEL